MEKKPSNIGVWIGLGIATIVGLIIYNVSTANNIVSDKEVSNAAHVVPVPTPVVATPIPNYYQPMQFNSSIETDRYFFVNACEKSAGWGRCNCDYDYLITHYGFAWFVEANANMEALGKIPYTEFNAAAKYCLQYQNL